MEKRAKAWTLGELAELLNGQLEGPEDLSIERPVPSDSHDPNGITFAETPKYLAAAEEGGVGAILIGPDSPQVSKPAIRVDSPRRAFGFLLAKCKRPLPLETGVHPTAIVADDAQVAISASIGPYAVVESGAIVDAHARIYPFAYIGEDCRVGEGCIVFPHAVLYQDVELGPGSIVHSGAVLGADGFGFGWDGKTRIKVPQVGKVATGESVEIGANTTVDRATAGTTTIGKGTKLDNLIQVGHNVDIGEDCVIAAQTGISGSVKIGNRVVMGGNVGTNDHIEIGDDVVLGGRSGVANDLLEPGEYFGTPALPKREALRIFVTHPKLPEIYTRLKELEKRLAELEKT